MKRVKGLRYNLQFFGESDGGEGASGNESGTEDNGGEAGSGSGGDSGNKQERTFTQEEVNKMMAREKKQGKSSVLKSLGFKSEEEAQNAVKMLNTLLDLQKTPEDKANDKATKAEDEKKDAERRATAAENKLSCLMAGVDKDSVEDALAIALLKVSDDKSLDKVLEEMKKEKKYSSFFGGGGDGSDSGTGTRPGHSNTGGRSNEPGQFGRDLVKQQKNPAVKKSSYFKED